jgi:hypothetical protein
MSKPWESAPRENLVRAVVRTPLELRAATDSAVRTLVGHFAVFNVATVIDSWWEGTFREQIAPGAFRKTFQERAGQIRCIYEHGHDPMFGRKPLGTPTLLEEDSVGAAYEVELFDTQLNREHVLPAAGAGQLGASFAFSVVKEEWNEEPDDGGLPMRTILEARVYEFGPCPFGAYDDATSGVRSGVDANLWHALSTEGRADLRRLLADANPTSTSGPGAGQATPTGEAATASTIEPGQPTRAVNALQRSLRLRDLDSIIKEESP